MNKIIINIDGTTTTVELNNEEIAELNRIEERNTIQKRIAELRANLDATDYQAIKFAEGELTESEFAPIREQRREWRTEINELEG